MIKLQSTVTAKETARILKSLEITQLQNKGNESEIKTFPSISKDLFVTPDSRKKCTSANLQNTLTTIEKTSNVQINNTNHHTMNVGGGRESSKSSITEKEARKPKNSLDSKSLYHRTSIKYSAAYGHLNGKTIPGMRSHAKPVVQKRKQGFKIERKWFKQKEAESLPL